MDCSSQHQGLARKLHRHFDGSWSQISSFKRTLTWGRPPRSPNFTLLLSLLDNDDIVYLVTHDVKSAIKKRKTVYLRGRSRGNMPRSSKLPVLNLLTGQKSAFSSRRGDSLHRFKWNLAQPRDTLFRLAKRNFMPIGSREWERGPKYKKKIQFLVNSLTDLWNFYGLLYDQLFCISVSNLTWFASQITELLLRNRPSVNYAKFASAPCRKNYALDQKMIRISSVLMVLTMWCLFFVTLRVRSAVCSRGV